MLDAFASISLLFVKKCSAGKMFSIYLFWSHILYMFLITQLEIVGTLNQNNQ